jgi:protein-L-isoaspartate(D-aspartate) O-methyltransferase
MSHSPRVADTYGISRDRMVDNLAARGIRDPRVLEAMRAVPRHLFVGEAFGAKAYSDNALPIGEKQTITQPYVVARMTELLEVGPDDRVLEIGTGSGYQAAVLSRLARQVYSVERIPALARRAQQILSGLGIINVSVKVFDGTYGWGEWAPYPAICVTAAAPDIPSPLIDQLAVGGRLVAPLGDEGEQVLVRVTRTDSGLDRVEHDTVSFVPLIGRYGHAPRRPAP